MDHAFVTTRVVAANAQLTLAQGQLDAAVGADRAVTPPEGWLEAVSKNLQAARVSIDEIGSQAAADAADEPSLRDCPSCGKSIRAEATLCGYCWSKL